MKPKDQGRDIPLNPFSRSHHEYGMGVLGRHPFGSPLELEPVSKNEVIPLGSIGPKCLFLLGRRSGLNLADLDAQAVTDLLEAMICPRVPGRVGDRTGGDQADSEAGLRASPRLGAVYECGCHKQGSRDSYQYHGSNSTVSSHLEEL
jgi:hypothetical protein